MAGPTPVSALIHAATMVTAGVYLIARSLPLYEVSETARLVVGIIGAITLVIGAVIGCAYDDIKKVLAYSTVSQIGYMFLAVAIPGAGAVAILHLLTHGFFKACMFLSAGSVMHGMGDQVDMRRFGGLRKEMPVTFACMSAGYLAIIGFPLFAGFFSKDLIIEAALDQGGARGWIFGVIAIAHRRGHRLLHDPHDDHDVLRAEALDRGPAPARVAAVMTDPDDDAGRRLGRFRLPAGPRLRRCRTSSRRCSAARRASTRPRSRSS